MNGYKAFYKGKTAEVYAETQIQARDKAVELFRARKPWDVTIVLCEKGDEQVVHTAVD